MQSIPPVEDIHKFLLKANQQDDSTAINRLLSEKQQEIFCWLSNMPNNESLEPSSFEEVKLELGIKLSCIYSIGFFSLNRIFQEMLFD